MNGSLYENAISKNTQFQPLLDQNKNELMYVLTSQNPLHQSITNASKAISYITHVLEISSVPMEKIRIFNHTYRNYLQQFLITMERSPMNMESIQKLQDCMLYMIDFVDEHKDDTYALSTWCDNILATIQHRVAVSA